MQEDYIRLKARVTEVENTMKETLESMDNLQANFLGILTLGLAFCFLCFFLANFRSVYPLLAFQFYHLTVGILQLCTHDPHGFDNI